MAVKAGYSTPMLHVQDVRRSIQFYEQLGFELIDDDGCEPIMWARMHCNGGAVMFLGAEADNPNPPHRPDRFMLIMYTPDLPALRAQLLAAGIAPKEISHPPYAKQGNMVVIDPDRYHLEIVHWSKTEDDAWEKHLEERKQKSAGDR